jgi:enoyl-CoA hydratase/carnithine racemase
LGAHGGMGATWLLPEAIGVPRAREMLYTGREVHAEEALEWGLVGGVSDDVLAYSLQWEALAQPVTMTTADLH